MLLEEMEQLNLVRSWKSAEDGSLFPYHPTPYERRDDMVRYDGYLPVTNVDELNYDEIGLWYMITDHGTQWADDVADSMGLEVSKYWAFRDEKESKTLTIYGEDQDSIDAAMSCWLNLNRQAVVLSDAQKNKAVPVMKTSNGRFLYHLLEFVYHYA